MHRHFIRRTRVSQFLIVIAGIIAAILLSLAILGAYEDCAAAGYNEFECRMMLQGNGRSVIVIDRD